MPKKRYTDEQIAFALRQAEIGTHSVGTAYRNELSVMSIRDRPSGFTLARQNACVERAVGSIHRIMLNHVVVLNDAHLL